MADAIYSELRLFFSSFFLGVIFFIGYDLLLILRNLWKHSGIVSAIEDILFWICISLYYFRIIYLQNHGILRWYSAAGLILGMIIYHNTMSDWLVNTGSTVLKKAGNQILKILLWLFSPILFLKKALKKYVKGAKIKIKKRLGQSSQKKEEKQHGKEKRNQQKIRN